MSNDDKKKSPFDGPPEGTEGLDEPTGQVEDDATRQITGDALNEIRESASHDMAPEWLEKMRARKQKAEEEESQDFDTPVPGDESDTDSPQTTEMDTGDAGSLTEGLDVDPEHRDGDTTEIERDATKAINRGELDTLMKEKEREFAQEDSDATSERPTPRAGVISKTSRAKTERATRDVDDEAADLVEEEDSSTGGTLPSPDQPSPATDSAPTRAMDEDALDEPEALDEDSFGDFTDDDLHAVVFGDQDDEDAGQQAGEVTEDAANAEDQKENDEWSLPKPESSTPKRADSSPSLDFSDIATDESEVELAEEPALPTDGPSSLDVDAPEPDREGPLDQAPQAPAPGDEIVSTDVAYDEDLDTIDDLTAPDQEEVSDEPELRTDDEDAADLEPPEDFPPYDAKPARPVLASITGFFAALLWVVGGGLGMFSSLPSPWQSTVPAMALGAGVVAFLLVIVGPPKKIEASVLAVLGIGIGGFAFVQWSNLGTVVWTDYLGIAPIVGAALAIIAAIATLFRPSGHVESI